MKPQTFIIFGPSGSGKGTQAQLLIEYLKTHDAGRQTLYVETGQKAREFSAGDSLTATLTKQIMQNGELLPEFIPIWMWSEFLIKHVSGNENLILEGLSRKEHEAPILDSAIQFYKRQNPIILSIEISTESARERLVARKRDDDTDADIEKRLGWYTTEVIPAINYFKNNSYYTFISLNGEQSIEKVFADIKEKLMWQ